MVQTRVSYELPTGAVTVTFSDDERNLLIGRLLSHLVWAMARQNRDTFRRQMTIFQDHTERDVELIERMKGKSHDA